MADVRILLISGSTRRGSGNTAALRTVRVPVPREAAGPDGIITDPAIRTALGAALSALAGASTPSVR